MGLVKEVGFWGAEEEGRSASVKAQRGEEGIQRVSEELLPMMTRSSGRDRLWQLWDSPPSTMQLKCQD